MDGFGPFLQPDSLNYLLSLHIAAKNGDLQDANTLLNARALVDDITLLAFETPLFLAVQAGHKEMAHLLLSKGADPNGHNRASHSPLIIAVSHNRLDLVDLLCQSGCDLNQRDEDGDPAIHTAAACGFTEMVKRLLTISRNKGVVLDLKGGSGRAAWWYARKFDKGATMRVLLYTKEWTKIKANDNRTDRPEEKPDVRDDKARSLNEIGITKLQNDVCRAKDYLFSIQSPKQPGTWKERLHFVVEVVGEDYDYEVIEPFRNGRNTKEPFVVVSYCWAKRTEEKNHKHHIKVPHVSGNGSDVRPLRVRPQVLIRSMEFAKARGIKRVWVDQECMHQGEADDKRILVGAMQKLYRQGTLTLALLDDHIQSVEDIQAIKLLGEKSRSTKHGDFQQSRIIFGRIFRDRWFSRAWTMQEAVSAGAERLVYMIGWEDHLDPQGLSWGKMAESLTSEFPKQTVRRELLLDFNNLWSMSYGIQSNIRIMSYTFLQRQTAMNEALCLRSSEPGQRASYNSSTFDDTLRNASSSLKHQRRTETNYSTHQQLVLEKLPSDSREFSILVLYKELQDKKSLMILDRPSILANLAGYE
ncbi:hypothetical protein PTNB73_03657 [Pyrenophora teres f. teres]|uniref:Arp n=1 Tax=Pyrenophora teres f. teres TaxID=97479 RepID=A0A6S6W4Y0_9PLEO|nr:hypothetical protein HRS9139_02712 [Pyrenophora teres f. teres]KAE8872198.1 hypothetical protein PTNB73_03657 [Pyrenophora teres f. teres]CAE7179914.1 Arp [Pyrenophora teres f. teres]